MQPRIVESPTVEPGSIDSRTVVTTPASSTRITERAVPQVIAWSLGAYVLLGALLVIAGRAIAVSTSLHSWDVGIDRWFVHHRGSTINTLSDIGSHLAETPTVVLAGLLVVGLLWWRHRDVRVIGAFAGGLLLEVTVFVTTTLLVDRPRPPVPRLDTAPPTSSFPSGHSAAAVALTIGLVVVLARVFDAQRLRVRLACALLALVPVAVGLARLSRGMHHPTDVIAGLLLGAACVATATVASFRIDAVRSDRIAEREEGP